MTFALVLFHESRPGSSDRLSEADRQSLRATLSALPTATEAILFTPARASDSYVDDGDAPPLGIQIHFDRLDELEAACGAGGPLAALPSALGSLAGTRVTAQAFWRRTWPVPDPVLQTTAGALPCSYVVHYPGPAQDLNAWLDHYVTGHPPLFQRFPGIRGIEILTRVDWICHLPHEKVDHMQRNRVLFDSPEALTRALQSPVRHELRADFHSFPPFEGGNFHYPMWTETVRP